MKPFILLAGCQRSGTTLLYRSLWSKYSGCLNPLKEMHYLDSRSGVRSKFCRLSAYRIREGSILIKNSGTSAAWKIKASKALFGYLATGSFKDYLRLAAVGEVGIDFTPSYYAVPRDELVEHIERLGAYKIEKIIMMRNPWERFRSNIRKRINMKGSVTNVEVNRMLERSLYARHIEKFLSLGFRIEFYEEVVHRGGIHILGQQIPLLEEVINASKETIISDTVVIEGVDSKISSDILDLKKLGIKVPDCWVKEGTG